MIRLRTGLSIAPLGILIATGAARLAAQQASAPQPGDQATGGTLRTTVRLVVLDVAVTDAKGHPATGLKQADFTLLEDHVPQRLASFVEHRGMTPEESADFAAKSKLPANTFSDVPVQTVGESGMIVFLLDASGTNLGGQTYLREQMIEYMKSVPAGTRIAVFQLDTQLHMIQGFTANPEELLAAVDSRRDTPKMPWLNYSGAPPEMRQQIRLSIFNDGVSGLGRYLSSFPGRKSLVWFTGSGAPISASRARALFVDDTNIVDNVTQMIDVLTLNRVAVYPVDADGLRPDPIYSAEYEGVPLHSTYWGLPLMVGHQDMDKVAKATGGEAFYDTNGLKRAMQQIAETSANYYTLSYSPSNRDFDGSFRKLTVKLAEQGLHLEYRSGYYGRDDAAALARYETKQQNKTRLLPAPTDPQRPASKLMKAMMLGALAPTDVLFQAKLAASQDVLKPGKGAVIPSGSEISPEYRKSAFRDYDIALSIDTKTLRLEPKKIDGYHGEIEVLTVVFDTMGQPVSQVITKANLDPDGKIYPMMMQGGVQTMQKIAVPARGDFFIRVGVHDILSDKIGTLELPVAGVKLGVPLLVAKQ
jgi:VWFA-related protein